MIQSDVVFHFTPGTWSPCDDLDCGHDGCGAIYGPDRQLIGRVYSKRDAEAMDTAPELFVPLAEAHANVRLFAAAPSMARALVAASHALRTHENGILASDVARRVADACDLALAQVTGSAS